MAEIFYHDNLRIKMTTGTYYCCIAAMAIVLSVICSAGAYFYATVPNPANNAQEVSLDAVLSWVSGNSAASHDIYMGTDGTAVADANRLLGDINGSGKTDLGDLSILAEQWLSYPPVNLKYWADINDDVYVNFVDFSVLATGWLQLSNGIYRGHYPRDNSSYCTGGLELGTTYYWRIDEVNDSTIWPGNVWSFTTIGGSNIAKASLGAIAVPSSQSSDSGLDYQVEKVIDDNISTFWASDYGTFPNWVEIRWPQPVNTNKIIINERPGYASATYRIDVFNDVDNSWQTVVGPKNNATPGGIITETFNTVEITKIRFYALTPYNGATQSGINSLEVIGTKDWLEACKSELPPYKPDTASFPAVSDIANYGCTSFSVDPNGVVPGSKVRINLQIRKTTVDTTNYGFQVRIGDISLNSYGDYTVALSAINPPIPTGQWVRGQNYPLSVDVYIPQWAPHGNISVIVTPLCTASRGTIRNATNNIVGTIKIQRFPTDPVPWPTTVPTTTVVYDEANDQTNLYVNGNLIQPYIMSTPDYTTYQSMGEQVTSNCQLWRLLTHKYVGADYGTTAGDAENAAYFAQMDQEINNLLKVDPNAYILPAFIIQASSAWTAAHPSDCTVLSNGTHLQYSLSSSVWASQIDYDYRALVAHLMSQSYSGHVIGVHFEMAQETNYWGYETNTRATPRDSIVMGDYSTSHITAFRTWLQTKYVTEAALRTAWNDPSVTFANAYPTLSVLRQMDSTLMFKNPATTKMPMDYWEFHADEMANMTLVAAKAIKEASGNKYITGLWGFYVGLYAAWPDAPGAMQHMGNTALQKVLASPYIDYLTCIQAYTHRRWGRPFYATNVTESIRHHGKMPLVELDVRTFFTPLWATMRTFSEPETLSVMYDYVWGAALRGDACWWVGFSAGATGLNRDGIPWYTLESVRNALYSSKKWYDAIRTTASPSTAQVAVFSNNDDVCAMDAYDGRNPLTSAQYQATVFELTKLGTPIDYYELSDISLDCMSQYKLYVFLNAYNLTTAQRDVIKAVVRQTGKTAVFLYGTGYNNGTTNSAANVQDLTGMVTQVTLEKRFPTVNFVSDANLPANYTLQPHPWENDSDPGAYTIGPIFDVDTDTNRTILGRYAHNNKVACASKTVGNGKSVYLGIPYMSSALLRKICRDSGVFLYSQNYLYLDADQHFILITNGSTAFNGSIALPQSSQVYDLWNNSIVTTGTSFTANIPANVSRMYFYGTSAEVAAFRAKVE